MRSDHEGPATIEAHRRAPRSLRVSVVTETYPPEVNGVAATLSRVVEGLRTRGHEVQLIRPRQGRGDVLADASPDEPACEVLVRGLPIPRYPQLKMGLPARRRLLELWSRQRPDVVHIVTEGPLGWSALQAARCLGLPVVSDFRTNFHAYSHHYGVQWLDRAIVGYLRWFHNRTGCTMVPTEALASELRARGFERLRVVARGVDTQLFDPARRSERLRMAWGADSRTMVLLYVGRLAPEKNLGLLLDAYDTMRLSAPGTKLVLVGDGPSAATLRQRCPTAVFAGLRRGEDLAMHYASADAFLFPSLTETFGNVVPEAMASGLAVLAFDHAAAGQLIRHGVDGLLAPPGDVGAWLALARRSAGEIDRVRALGAAARERARALDWDRIVTLVEAQYLAALRGPAEVATPDIVALPAR